MANDMKLPWTPAQSEKPDLGDLRAGSILVVVLMLTGLIAALASAAAETQRASYAAGLAYADGLRAEAAMRSAIERTVAHGGSRTQQLRGGIVQLEQATVTLAIRDEASRIDLNMAPRELLAGLFRALGSDENASDGLAGRLVAWRQRASRDSEEEAPKRVVGEGVLFPTNPFLHPAQIAQVPGIDRAVAAAVVPYLTVASSRPTINPMLAELPVLLAVPGMTDDLARSFMAERNGSPAGFDKLVREIKKGTEYLSLTSGAASRFQGRVRIGNRTERVFEVVVAVIAEDNVPYRILAWEAAPTRAGASR